MRLKEKSGLFTDETLKRNLNIKNRKRWCKNGQESMHKKRWKHCKKTDSGTLQESSVFETQSHRYTYKLKTETLTTCTRCGQVQGMHNTSTKSGKRTWLDCMATTATWKSSSLLTLPITIFQHLFYFRFNDSCYMLCEFPYIALFGKISVGFVEWWEWKNKIILWKNSLPGWNYLAW